LSNLNRRSHASLVSRTDVTLAVVGTNCFRFLRSRVWVADVCLGFSQLRLGFSDLSRLLVSALLSSSAPRGKQCPRIPDEPSRRREFHTTFWCTCRRSRITLAYRFEVVIYPNWAMNFPEDV